MVVHLLAGNYRMHSGAGRAGCGPGPATLSGPPHPGIPLVADMPRYHEHARRERVRIILHTGPSPGELVPSCSICATYLTSCLFPSLERRSQMARLDCQQGQAMCRGRYVDRKNEGSAKIHYTLHHNHLSYR